MTRDSSIRMHFVDALSCLNVLLENSVGVADLNINKQFLDFVGI